jgi:hypothetical protein
MPFVCRAILLIALTYYGILNLLFLGMLVFSGYIRKASDPWFELEGTSPALQAMIIITGLLILLACTSGIVLFLRQRRGGFYIFLGGAVLLWIADFFLLEFDWIRYLINTGFIFFLGILHFSRKCYKNNSKTKSN